MARAIYSTFLVVTVEIVSTARDFKVSSMTTRLTPCDVDTSRFQHVDMTVGLDDCHLLRSEAGI